MNETTQPVKRSPLSEDQLAEHWRGIERKRLRRRQIRQRRMRIAGAGAVMVLLVAAWSLGRESAETHAAREAELAVDAAPRAPLPVLTPASAESTPAPALVAPAPFELKLLDGATLHARVGAVLEQCEDPAGSCILLHEGSASFEVASHRELAVRAGSILVVSRAAVFTVTRHTAGTVHRVELHVESGSIDLSRDHSLPYPLSAGESVTLGESEPAPALAAPSPPSARPSSAAMQRSDADREQAQDLWTQAMQARRAGRDADAAARYAELLETHPRDPKAGLAALELARLRMDTLGDVPGAVSPLERALRDGRESTREDALARLVRAHAALSQVQRCKQRRRQYLESFPEGVHSKAVARSCTPT